MSENKKPSIRFKGFTEAWEQRKLTEILIQRTEHQKISGDVPLLAFSYAEGVINPEDKKSNKRDFIMTDKYNKIFSRTELNDIIYNPANVIHGAIHRNKLGTGVVSPIYKIFMCNGVSPKFIGERLHTDKFIQEVTKYIEGTVVKLRTLSPEMFLEMSIEIPKSYEEQDKIGTYFTNLDNLITLHQRKYDKLVNVKKSMLEKMFPRDGKNVPEIRFSGFTEAWEQRKLGELVDVCSGRDYKHLSEGTIPVYGTGGYMLSVNDALSYDRDAIGIGRKGTIDRPYILKAPFWTVDTLFYAIPREKVDLNFAFDIFQNIDWKKKDESTGVPSLSKTAINDIDVLAPKYGEQQTIGQFFAAIDNLITLHQREVEKLQNIKKSCLEKMFV